MKGKVSQVGVTVKKRKLSGLVIKRWCNSQLKGMQCVVNKNVKVVPSFNKRYMKGIPFMSEMVQKGQGIGPQESTPQYPLGLVLDSNVH